MNKKQTILIVDDEQNIIDSLNRALSYNFNVITANSLNTAFQKLSPDIDAIILDLCLNENDSTNRDGIKLLQEKVNKNIPAAVIVFTAHGDVETAVQCMKIGAADFIDKSKINLQELKVRIEKAIESNKSIRKLNELQNDFQRIEPLKLVGESESIKEILKQIKIVAEDGYASVLIYGETGTGKEIVARLIHASGWRKDYPFLPYFVSSQQSLVETDLFGNEKGAYTGADKRFIGYVERANRGVLFLDEINCIPIDIQPKLLRLLEEKKFYRIHGETPIEVDVQIISATNIDLNKLIKEGKFRIDLFYRLNGVMIFIPPLRERKEDIPLLIKHFIDLFHKSGRFTIINSVNEEAISLLQEYDWPGNVRELRNVIEYGAFSALKESRDEISIADLPDYVKKNEVTGYISNNKSIYEILAYTELKYISDTLKRYNGNKSVVYKNLGYQNKVTFYRRINSIAKKFPGLTSLFPELFKK